MTKSHVWMALLAMAGVSAPLQAATLTNSGNWNVGTNWDTNAVPSAESVTIASGRTATLDSAVPSVTQITLGTSAGTGAWIINTGADLTTTSASAGRSLTIGSSRTSNVTQTGGTIDATSGGMFLAYSGTGFVGTTTWDISAGSLAVGSDPDDQALTNLGIVIGRQGDATMTVSGASTVTATGGIYLGQIGISSGSLVANLALSDTATLSSDRGLETGLHATNTITNIITLNGGSITTGSAGNSGSWRLNHGDGSTTTVNHSAGNVNIGTNDLAGAVDDSLVLGVAGTGSAAYNISGGVLTVDDSLIVGAATATGTFNITNNAAQVFVGSATFGANANLSAVSGSTVTFTSNTGASTVDGNVLVMTDAGATSSNLAGLGELMFVFAGGAVGDPADIGGFEVAGADIGAVMAGLVDNFALAGLKIGDGVNAGAIKLIDLADNSAGVEALYVEHLVVTAGSVIDLNGLNLYYLTAQIDGSATFLNGTPTQLLVPEPAAIGLTLLGAALLPRRRRAAR